VAPSYIRRPLKTSDRDDRLAIAALRLEPARKLGIGIDEPEKRYWQSLATKFLAADPLLDVVAEHPLTCLLTHRRQDFPCRIPRK
jgi:hypothetical protein